MTHNYMKDAIRATSMIEGETTQEEWKEEKLESRPRSVE